MKRLFFIPIILLLTSCTLDREEILYVKIKDVAIKKEINENIYQGYIKRSSDIELGFNLSGILTERKNEGDFVKKGELIAKLDSDEYVLNVEKAKLELENAKILNSRAKSYFERISKLYQAGGISYNDWEAAQTDLKSSANRIEMLNDTVKIASKQENYTKIYAPYNGFIIRTYKDPHQYVFAGEKIFYFQGNNSTEGKIFVSQNNINDIKIGDIVSITADILPNKKFKGIVKNKINSSLNKGSYEVKILFIENTHELLDGMSINVRIKSKNKISYFIPIESIFCQNDKNYVFLFNKINKNEGILSKKEVITGEIKDEYIEVKEGLNGTEKIAVEKSDRLYDGMVVRMYE